MSRKPLLRDNRGHRIQSFVPDPAKSQVPIVSGGTVLLSSYINVGDTVAIHIYSSAILTRYFNSDTTKVFTIPADTPTLIYLDETTTEVTLLGAATIQIEAM